MNCCLVYGFETNSLDTSFGVLSDVITPHFGNAPEQNTGSHARRRTSISPCAKGTMPRKFQVASFGYQQSLSLGWENRLITYRKTPVSPYPRYDSAVPWSTLGLPIHSSRHTKHFSSVRPKVWAISVPVDCGTVITLL